MFLHLVIYVLSFVGIWLGSGLAIRSVERLSRSLKISSFAISFLVLGFFTSISELSVGINSLIENDPEIYVGNLIGASIVLFLLIVPLLAIIGNTINIADEFQGFNLPASLVVIALPVLLTADGQLTRIDSVIILILFGILVVSIQSKRGLIENFKSIYQVKKIKAGKELLRILFGVIIIFFASHSVVEQTIYFSQLLHASSFLLSLLLIAIGTNIPELSLVVRSIFMRNKQVAFGDYVGSAAFNTFLMGGLTLAHGKTVSLVNNYNVSLLFLIIGLVVFHIFAKSKNSISRFEGLMLLLIYFAFLSSEAFLHKNIFAW